MAISLQEKALSLTPEGHAAKSIWLSNLGWSLRQRAKHHPEKVDVDKILSTYKAAANCLADNPLHQWAAARLWAITAYNFRGLQCSLEAHESVMKLISRLVWLGATVSKRYNHVAKVSDSANSAAAAALEAGNLRLAVEWAEQGRSVVWAQLLSLRTPLDDLHDADPLLASQLKQVCRELESGTNSDDRLQFKTNKQPKSLEMQAQYRRRLAAKWEELINHTRHLPGFETFLLPNPFGTLAKAAHSGYVVLINVDHQRCDAMVLCQSKDIVHVALPGLTLDRCNAWRASLQQVIKEVRQSQRIARAVQSPGVLEDILASLWCAVVQPIFEALTIPAMSTQYSCL
jgi:hypothetical protein